MTHPLVRFFSGVLSRSPGSSGGPRLRLGFVAVFSALVLGGCGIFGGEKDPRPPRELEPLTPRVRVDSLWSERVGAGTDERRFNLVPAFSGGRLYVADTAGRILALNADDGRILWQRETDLPFSGGPEVDGEYLVLGSSDGDVVAYAAQDGAERWRTRLDSEVLSVPRIAGSRLLVHALDDSVYAFDLATGAQLWKYSDQIPVLTLRGSSTPALSGDNLVVGVSGGKLMNLEPATGLPHWGITITPPHGRSELARIADIDADPVIVGGIVYAATYNGDLAAVELASGDVLWRRRLPAYAGLTAAAGVLYVTDSDDVVWALTAADGTPLWKQEAFRYRRLTAPAVLGDLVAVGDLEGYVHWLDRRDGVPAARVRVANGPVTGHLRVVGSRLYVYADDGTLAALTAIGTPEPVGPPVSDPAPDGPPERR